MSPDFTDLLSLILRFNLGLAAAIALVLALRALARRFFGARIAYALWIIPPLVAAMSFLPARTETVTLPAASLSAAQTVTPLGALAPTPAPAVELPIDLPVVMMVLLWAGGFFLSFLVLALRQRRFVKALGRLSARSEWGKRVFAAETNAGVPAVLGAVRPMIVTPADFDTRYSADERRVVIAHERAHMAQGDPLINALTALIQCVSWFNPLVHVASRALRMDQELACDEAVMARPNAPRRAYAEALLKAHASAVAAPLGCAWPPHTLKALKERIAMLKRTIPSRATIMIGAAIVALVTVDVCALAWSAQPARTVTVMAQPHNASVKRIAAIDEHVMAYSSDELEGGLAESNYFDEAALQAEMAAAMDEAERAMEETQRELEANARYMVEHRDEAGLTDEDIRQIEQDVRDGRREAEQAAREARQEAMEAAREAAREQAEAEREAQREALEEQRMAMAEAHQHRLEAQREALRERQRAMVRISDNTSEALAALREHTSELSQQAAELVRLSFNPDQDSEGEREALQAEMEAHRQAIEHLVRQIERGFAD